MNKKFNDIFFKQLNDREKQIWSSTLLQSGILFVLLLIGSTFLQFTTDLFKELQWSDMALLSLVIGYSYFVVKVAWKGVLYTEKNISKLKYSTCVFLSFVSICIILSNFIYWRLDAFLFDPQRVQFGNFIFSGSIVIVFYTISNWINLCKLKNHGIQNR